MAFAPYVEEGGRILLHFKYAFRSRQAKPYKAPLPYKMFIRRENGCVGLYQGERRRYDKGMISTPDAQNTSVYTEAWHINNVSSEIKNLHAQVHNKALSKVADKLSYVSNLFEAWYERKEAYTLLGQAGKSLLNILRNWKKPKFWKQLMEDAGRKAKQPESLPEAWLLLQFAIKPLIGTIDDCMNLLLSDFPVYWEEGSSGIDIPLQKWPTQAYTELYITGTRFVKIGVEVKSLNPNAQLSNIMGLTTPFSTFLNVVPWFWAVNYFVNINDIISNFEVRFPGINIGKTYTTVFSKNAWFGQNGPNPYIPELVGGYYRQPTGPFVKYDGESTFMDRTVSNQVPPYKLERSFPALGTNQFANLFSAIALTMKGSAPKKG